MVNDVAKLTRSIRRSVIEDRARRSVIEDRAKSSLRNMSDDRKRQLLDELEKNGRAVYSDSLGNRYQIERKGA